MSERHMQELLEAMRLSNRRYQQLTAQWSESRQPGRHVRMFGSMTADVAVLARIVADHAPIPGAA